MLPFLKPSNRNEVREPVDESRVLLDEFAMLDANHKDEVAERLAILWQCFVEEFDSPAEFHHRPEEVQDAYIAKFERVAERSQHVKQRENGHLHYSVALILHFLRIARDGARQQSALDLSGRVASLINRARERKLASTRSYLVDALSTSLLDPPAHLNTEVIVDRPMEFHDDREPSDAITAEGQGEQSEATSTSRRRGTRAVYKRTGERWVKSPEFRYLRRAS